MGNKDGIVSALKLQGTNEILNVDGSNGYFSFAHGDEIAYCKDGYYILNCSSELWKKVQNKVKKTKNVKELEKWWLKMSEQYEISEWSNDFSNLMKAK